MECASVDGTQAIREGNAADQLAAVEGIVRNADGAVLAADDGSPYYETEPNVYEDFNWLTKREERDVKVDVQSDGAYTASLGSRVNDVSTNGIAMVTGGINAMTFGSDEEPYVAITSLMTKIMSEEQMRFVVGHECGHIAMRHMVYHTAATVLGSLSQYIPFIGKIAYSGMSIPLNAWARRSEITADRAGLHCCEDPEVAKKALLQLECAFNSADDIDIETYLENSRHYLNRGIVRKIGEYGANHPMTPKRIEALDLFANSELYYQMMGKHVPAGVLSAEMLEKKVESIVRVL
jgi:hypothetical protein